MADEPRGFYTPTLAGLYERQGHLDKAAEVYRFLLNRDPGRDDLRIALGRVERRLFEENPRRLEETIPLLCRWLELLTAYGSLMRLRKVGGQKSEVRSQRSEVRGQRSEVRGQRSEVRGQRSEVRNQRSEVRDQRSETGNWKL